MKVGFFIASFRLFSALVAVNDRRNCPLYILTYIESVYIKCFMLLYRIGCFFLTKAKGYWWTFAYEDFEYLCIYTNACAYCLK